MEILGGLWPAKPPVDDYQVFIHQFGSHLTVLR